MDFVCRRIPTERRQTLFLIKMQIVTSNRSKSQKITREIENSKRRSWIRVLMIVPYSTLRPVHRVKEHKRPFAADWLFTQTTQCRTASLSQVCIFPTHTQEPNHNRSGQRLGKRAALLERRSPGRKIISLGRHPCAVHSPCTGKLADRMRSN